MWFFPEYLMVFGNLNLQDEKDIFYAPYLAMLLPSAETEKAVSVPNFFN